MFRAAVLSLTLLLVVAVVLSAVLRPRQPTPRPPPEIPDKVMKVGLADHPPGVFIWTYLSHQIHCDRLGEKALRSPSLMPGGGMLIDYVPCTEEELRRSKGQPEFVTWDQLDDWTQQTTRDHFKGHLFVEMEKPN